MLNASGRKRATPLAIVGLLLMSALIPAGPAAAIPLDFSATDIATDIDGAYAVAVADLDGDGDQDLVSAGFVDDELVWYENDGGDPGTWSGTVVSTTANGPSSIVAADLDGDGDNDLITSSSVDDTIAWYENDNGAGSSWTATDVATTADNATDVAAGDLDGDGDIDLASASITDNTIAWYENTAGDASAWTPTDITALAMGATSVAIGDIDGDGDMDLATASQNDDRIAWLENSAGDASSWTPDSINVTADNAQSVAIGDLDGDGDLDLASASYSDDTVAWYENSGDGSSWTPADITTTADGAQSVTIADLDVDGDLDVASASDLDDTVAWYENTAGDASTWVATDATTAADEAQAVTDGDLDGDGDPDLAAASQADDTLSWVENELPARNQPSWEPFTINSQNGLDPTMTTLVDLDGDGDLDAVNVESANDNALWIENLNGDGTAWLSADLFTTADQPIWITPGDIDSDGDADLVVGHFNGKEVTWYENTGNFSSWPATTVLAGTASIRQIAAADLDGDGDVDLASTESTDGDVAIHLNNGDGSGWASSDVFATETGVAGLTAGDLDGDGDVDLASTTISFDRIRWFENVNGDASSWTDATVSQTADGPEELATGDLDGDGDLDLVSTSWNDDTLAWYENTNGDGSTWNAVDIDTSLQLAESPRVGDLDGDGDLDIAATDPENGEIMWFSNDAGDASVWSPHEITEQGLGASSLSIGDVDNDGDLDVLSGNSINTGPNITLYRALPTMTIANESVEEGGDLEFVVSVGRNHDTVEVDATTSEDTAQAGDDFTAKTKLLTIPPGDTNAIFKIVTKEDGIDEDDEIFFADFSTATNSILNDGRAKGTIEDDDAKPKLSVNNVSKNEGNSGTKEFVFEVKLNKESGKTVEVHYKTDDDSASSPGDFDSKNGDLTFKPGVKKKEVTIKVSGDKKDEKNEVFFLKLTDPVKASLDDSKGKGTIKNDD